MSRQCDNWLKTLGEYVEETESPRHFWLWSGISVLSLALQRRVWLQFGMDKLYPNLYVLIIAKPGKCRKGPPVRFAKKILSEVGVPVFVDSPTKRALTKELDRLGRLCHFKVPGDPVPCPQSPLALINTEMSSILASDPKAIIDILTELFDSPDTWRYKTSDKGEDEIFGACVGCFIATTPTWLADNLPNEAIGGGFTARFITLFGDDKYKPVPLPPPPPEDLYHKLKHDLSLISKISGPFDWGPGALEYYDKWYRTIESKVRQTHDDRIHGYLERIHIFALKTAMVLHVSRHDSRILEVNDLGQAITMLEGTIEDLPRAFGGHGKDPFAGDKERIKNQIRSLRTTTLAELLRLNYQQINKRILIEILEDLQTMDSIEFRKDNGKTYIMWKGGK